MKLLSSDSMVGFSEAQKVAAISKVFSDSYKSPLSVIVVDNLERLLGTVVIRLFSVEKLAKYSIFRLHAYWASVLKCSTAGAYGTICATATEGKVF